MVVAFALVIAVCFCSCCCCWSQPIASASLSPSGTWVLPWRDGDTSYKTAHNPWSISSALVLVPGSLGAYRFTSSDPTTRRSCGWWAASCWSSRRNGSWSAAGSSARPQWPRARIQKRPWSSPMVNLPRRRLEPSTELSQRLCRSTQNSSIAELPIQRSGFIVNKRS
jgi:hypothetical protein